MHVFWNVQWSDQLTFSILLQNHVRNEEVLLRVNEQRNIIHDIIKRKANWIGHILRRNCLLKQVIEGKIKRQIEVTRRQGRRRKKLLNDLKDRRGYCELKEEALDRTMWRNRFARGFGPVISQITDDDNTWTAVPTTIIWVMQLTSQSYHICNAVQPTSFTISLFAACKSSGFLLCNNFRSNRDLSSSSKIEFLGHGGGGATGTSFSLMLMYGGSSCK